VAPAARALNAISIALEKRSRDTIGDHAYFAGGALDPGGGGTTDQLLMFHRP
jgi:hypothetical protein